MFPRGQSIPPHFSEFQFLPRITEHAEKGAIRFENFPVNIPNHHPYDIRIQKPPETGFRPLEPFLEQLTAGTRPLQQGIKEQRSNKHERPSLKGLPPFQFVQVSREK